MSANPEYFLPFDASQNPILISQGRNGPWSHKLVGPHDYSNAVDFALPVGTEVRVARAGRLFKVVDKYNRFYEGLDPEIGNELSMRIATNHAGVLHDDGTLAIYSHLAQGSIRRQNYFEAGEVLAQTGRSGWIAKIPHLHFEVRLVGTPSIVTIPMEFVNYQGSLDHQTLLSESRIWFGE